MPVWLNTCIFFECNVYILFTFSNKPNPAAIDGKTNGLDGQVSGRACESCYGKSSFIISRIMNYIMHVVPTRISTQKYKYWSIHTVDKTKLNLYVVISLFK